MERINIAELLKDCPTGMELDCTMYDNVTLLSVSTEGDYPIEIVTKSGFSTRLTKYGQNVTIEDAKCVIFPKGKTTWEGFQRPFKDGDVLSNGICICIYNGNESKNYYGLYVGVGHIDHPNYFILSTQNSYFTKGNAHLATEEEKQQLFQAIKDNGYKWNVETKTLERLIEPKFKVGDKVRNKNNHNVVFTITSIEEYSYVCGAKTAFWFDDQDNYELVPNKFDITTLKPFESRVLVRNTNDYMWKPAIYGFVNSDRYYIVGGSCWQQCIPYKGNEYLLSKTDDCDEYYKTWKE